MTLAKTFGILIEAQGGRVGAQGALIAGIADIAGIARDRKGKTLPLMNTDDTDQE